MTNRIDIRKLLGQKPFAIYLQEVSEKLGFYELAILAADLVNTDPPIKDVCQFIFITKGGLLSKVIRIRKKNGDIIELPGDSRINSLIREGMMKA